jgi:hypothetical protein
VKGRERSLSPGEVVARAYRAANRGRYADANRYISRSVLRSMQLSRRVMRGSRKKIAASLATVQDKKQRTQLERLLETTRHFEDSNYSWKLSTRRGSIASLEVARETIRGDNAIVTLRLRLVDGKVVSEREPLVRTRAGWRIGDGMALQNNGMQLTSGAARRASRARHLGAACS